MSLFQVSQVDEVQYLGRCSKRYHHRPRQNYEKTRRIPSKRKGILNITPNTAVCPYLMKSDKIFKIWIIYFCQGFRPIVAACKFFLKVICSILLSFVLSYWCLYRICFVFDTGIRNLWQPEMKFGFDWISDFDVFLHSQPDIYGK